VRARAEVGLSGHHAPSDAVKSLPGLVMMVGKPVMKLSGIFPGQLHPELASGVQLDVRPRADERRICEAGAALVMPACRGQGGL
jgi:hypothetical protein